MHFSIILITLISLVTHNSELIYGKTILETKPYLWVYWENLNTTKMPAHISLCRKTLLKHCNTSFNIIQLDEKTIYTYLPELKQIEASLNLNRLKIAQKVDFYRILLLYKYGGLYIDADIIVMRDLKEITEKLRHYDYIGFGEFNIDQGSYNSYGAPQNWVMASRKKGILITNLLKNIIQILLQIEQLNNQQLNLFMLYNSTILKPQRGFDWHALGKDLIQKTLIPLIQRGYRYYHYANDVDGTRDIFGNFVTTARIFSNHKIKFKDINKLLFIFTSNETINLTIKEYLTMSEEQQLKEKTNFSLFIKKSLELAKYK